MTISEKFDTRAKKINSLLCVGLDADMAKIPERFKKMEFPQFEFNKYIIEETHEYASAYKPNSAFYEARGDKGIKELK
jgi:orotidine-5'-phosphate decarboxylase